MQPYTKNHCMGACSQCSDFSYRAIGRTPFMNHLAAFPLLINQYGRTRQMMNDMAELLPKYSMGACSQCSVLPYRAIGRTPFMNHLTAFHLLVNQYSGTRQMMNDMAELSRILVHRPQRQKCFCNNHIFWGRYFYIGIASLYQPDSAVSHSFQHHSVISDVFLVLLF